MLKRANTPKKVSARDGLELDPTPNDFRHEQVSHLRAARIDPADMAMVAGHSVETGQRALHARSRPPPSMRSRSVVG